MIPFFKLDNAGIKTNVYFDMDITVMLDKGKRIENNLKKAMEAAFENIARKYRGYPSSLHKTKEIYIKVFEGLPDATANVKELDQFAEKIQINIDYEKAHLDKEYSFLASVLIHELLHIVSKVHEGQEQFKQQILSHAQTELGGYIRLQESFIRDAIRTTKYFGDELFLNKDIKKEVPIFHIISKEFERFIKYFWNWISDVALDLIAIRLQSWTMMTEFSQFSKNQVSKPAHVILVSEKYFHNDEEKLLSQPNTPEREQKLNLIYLWEWMLMVSIYPFHAIAYAREANPYDDPELNKKFHGIHSTAVNALKEYETLINHTTHKNKPVLHEFDKLMRNIADTHYAMGVNPDFHATNKIIHHEGSINASKQALSLAYNVYKEYQIKAGI